IAGGIFGETAGATAAGVGQFAAGSVLLKYSRGAETQADLMGTQVLYDAGYDPRAMAAFLKNLARNPLVSIRPSSSPIILIPTIASIAWIRRSRSWEEFRRGRNETRRSSKLLRRRWRRFPLR